MLLKEKLVERFLKYVKIDTQSKEGVEDKFPSTDKQKNLALLLVDELNSLGLYEVEIDQYGYVYATLPSNLAEDEDKVPPIGFLAHLDTSPEVSGENVKPIIHENYSGGDIVLPGDPSQVIKFEENPSLKQHIGDDIITSDGTTLLGADDKAGIAEIITAIEYLINNPDIKHGKIKLAFTPDEEVGNGTKHFDVNKFGVKYAYTVDGESLGEIENETFNASTAIFNIHGINVHPGYAKNKLVNAIKIASFIVSELEKKPSPETTEKREGYLHPYVIEGGVEKCTLKVLIRDFELSAMKEKEIDLNKIKDLANKKYPKSKIELEIKESYRNMKIKLEEDPKVVEYALEAVKRSGLEPKLQIIRGGTDGAKLCFKGILTPNIFTGGHNFHSKQEWISIQAMEKAVQTILNLIKIWPEKSLAK
ncbi:MAG: peptidase T [Candidatus Marinimicrobia bacterium]|nr:peptidase T [Candidatus Neomarinimicrobiota bacterium]